MIYLVGGWATSLKNMSSSVGRIWNSQYMQSHHKLMFQTTNQWFYTVRPQDTICLILYMNIDMHNTFSSMIYCLLIFLTYHSYVRSSQRQNLLAMMCLSDDASFLSNWNHLNITIWWKKIPGSNPENWIIIHHPQIWYLNP